MFGDSIRRVSRNTYDFELILCVFDINVVVSGAAERKYFYSEGAELVDNGSINGIVYENADSFAALGKLGGILVQLGLIKLEFYVLFLAELFKCVSYCFVSKKATFIVFHLHVTGFY